MKMIDKDHIREVGVKKSKDITPTNKL